MTWRGGLKLNVLSNVGGYACNVLIAFLISPIIIRSLGDSRYGVWALVAQLTGYYGLLDLGIRSAITYYTARHIARGESRLFNVQLASGFWFLATLSIAALLIGGSLVALFPVIFDAGDADLGNIQIALAIMTVVVALNLPMTTLSGAIVGYQRLDLVNAIEIVTRAIAAVATWVAMKSGGGLIALACIQAGMSVTRWILSYGALRGLAGAFSLRPGVAERPAVKMLAGYGTRSLVVDLAITVVNRTDLVIIGVFLSTRWITVYSIGAMLVQYASSAVSSVTQSITPRLTQLASVNDTESLRATYLLGARTAASVAAPLGACILVFARPFIALWLGQSYVTGPWGERSDVIACLLLAAHAPRALQSISWQLIYATRRQGFLARLTAVEAVFNLVISIVLVRYWGIVGVAIGTLIPLVVTHTLVVPRFVRANYGLSVREFVAKGVGRSLVVGLLAWLTGSVLVYAAPPTSWSLLVLEGFVVILIIAAATLAVVLRSDERARLAAMIRAAARRG